VSEPLKMQDGVVVHASKYFLAGVFNGQAGTISRIVQVAPGEYEYDVCPFSRDRPGLTFRARDLVRQTEGLATPLVSTD
jgi:hypothetical protein